MSVASNSEDEDNDDRPADAYIVHLQKTKTLSSHGNGKNINSRKINEYLAMYVSMFLHLSDEPKDVRGRDGAEIEGLLVLLYLAGVYQEHSINLEELGRRD
ncbi:hypothetical protein NPIL_223921 [Nephila pilipes]|uniref:Uncharacterized protein n=1 Tax=Nephila pilipes TaxID=299642 RepID=A0A8X6PL72_NEPPI|nr:hypothetical protein NPIL_223921 [Nephila pilipes]